jgi:hypothetical protein
VASLQPIVTQVGGGSVTVAVRSQAVLAAVQGQQQQFAAAAAAALKVARGERMQQRFERRKHQWESPPQSAARDGAAGARRESVRPSGSPSTAVAGSTLAPASLATAAAGDSLADDFRGVLGDAQMFVAERLEDMADEARCLGLAPAVAFDVTRAVFVSAATGAPLDLTRELGGVLFDNLGALADGAAMVLAASGSPPATAAGGHPLAQAQLAAPLTAVVEDRAAAAAGGSSHGVAGATASDAGAGSSFQTDAQVSRERQPAAAAQQPAPAVDIADFPKY